MRFDDWVTENRRSFKYLDLIPIPDGSVGVWLDGSAHYDGLFEMIRLPCEALAVSFATRCRCGADEQELDAFVTYAWGFAAGACASVQDAA